MNKIISILILSLIMISTNAFSQTLLGGSNNISQPVTALKAGKDFIIYENPVYNYNSNQIEIIYFFSYGSPWSQQIDHELRVWAKTQPYPIKFTPSPVFYGQAHEIFYARVFFALKKMDKESEIGPLFLNAVVNQEKDFNKIANILDFMEQNGVNKDAFVEALNSQEVKMHTARTGTITKDYQIYSIPAVVINGQYLIRANQDMPPKKFLESVKFLTKVIYEGKRK